MPTITVHLGEAYVKASCSGNVEKMDKLLQVPFGAGFVQIPQIYFDRALCLAAENGDFMMIAKLLKEGRADQNYRRPPDNNNFIQFSRDRYWAAAASGNVEKMDQISGYIQFPEDVVSRALVVAAKNGHISVVTKLLEEGRADPNFVVHFFVGHWYESKNLLNSLEAAVKYNQKEVVLKLLDDIRVKPTIKALLEAIRNNSDDEIIEKLLNGLKGADVDLTECLKQVLGRSPPVVAYEKPACNPAPATPFDNTLTRGFLRLWGAIPLFGDYGPQLPAETAKAAELEALAAELEALAAEVEHNIKLAKRLLEDGRFNLKYLWEYVNGFDCPPQLRALIFSYKPELIEYVKKELNNDPKISSFYNEYMRRISTLGLALAENKMPRNVVDHIASFVPGFQSAKFVRRGLELDMGNCPKLDWSDWLNLGGPLYSMKKWLMRKPALEVAAHPLSFLPEMGENRPVEALELIVNRKKSIAVGKKKPADDSSNLYTNEEVEQLQKLHDFKRASLVQKQKAQKNVYEHRMRPVNGWHPIPEVRNASKKNPFSN